MPDSFQMFARCSYFQWRGLSPMARQVSRKMWDRGVLPTIDAGVAQLYPIWTVERETWRRPVTRTETLHLISVKVDLPC